MPDISFALAQNAWFVIAALGLTSSLLIALRVRCDKQYREAQTMRLRHLESIENLGEGFYRSTPDGRITYVNRALARMLGHDTGEEFLAAMHGDVTELYVDPRQCIEFRRQLRENGHVKNFVSEIRSRQTGKTFWVSENGHVVPDPKTGEIAYYEGSLRDVTEQVERHQFEVRLEKLAANLPGGLFQLRRDQEGKFSVPYLSVGFVKLLDIDEEAKEIDPRDYFSFIHEDDRETYTERLRFSAVTLTQWTSEFRYFNKDGRMLWLHLTATPEMHDDGTILWHGHISDVSKRKNAEAKVRHLADFDTLTELPNRRVFTRKLEDVITHCSSSGQHAAVLFIDLDNFKTLNDTHGHELGDELLRKVADRLETSARASDTVSRFGGDEFVLLIENLGKDRTKAIAGASGAANKILREFAKGFDLGDIHHVTSPSIGAIVFDGSELTASQIIKGADIAMYEAKKGGRNRLQLFDPDDFEHVSAGYALQSQLRHASANSELFFEFQPLVEAGGGISGCEALVRWQHPERGRLAPGEFIPIAEKTGMIREINDWVLHKAVSTLSEWSTVPAMRAIRLAANISVQQFSTEEFVPELAELIHKSGVDPSLLTLELTEHMMARNPDQVAKSMNELKSLGVRLSLDDFGTGYSSLSQLNRFPFDEVKIDGSFVAAIENSRSNRSLIEAILAMAAALDLDTVAEHVGSPFQVAFLKERGCRRFQGYFYHPPMPADELLDLMATVRAPGRPPLSLVK